MSDIAGWGLILISAILDWLAVGFGWNKAKYITKPLVMILLITWMTIQGGWHFPVLWFTLGAIFSLLGDVFLMLPGNFFLAGLVSFLLAHLLYITGFLYRVAYLVSGIYFHRYGRHCRFNRCNPENSAGCPPEDRCKTFALGCHHL